MLFFYNLSNETIGNEQEADIMQSEIVSKGAPSHGSLKTLEDILYKMASVKPPYARLNDQQFVTATGQALKSGPGTSIYNLRRSQSHKLSENSNKTKKNLSK